jgi:phage gp29-like protein
MSKAVLGQTLTSDAGGGSYAQSKTHNEVRHDLTVADCKAIAATLRRDLIRPLVIYNFGEDKRIPYIRFDCEEAEDQNETADIYDKLIGWGLKISTAHLYKKFSIPKPEDNEEVVAPARQLPLKNDLRVVTNKVETDEELQKITKEYQDNIDKMADAAINQSKDIFTRIFEPIKELLEQSESLEELKQKLEDDKFVENIYKSMDIEDLEELLQKAMFYADLLGRMKENERPV